MKNLKEYESPLVQIIDVEVEKGFAVSDVNGEVIGSLGEGNTEGWVIEQLTSLF